MKFKEKYSTETEVGKIKVTVEAFAIGELLEEVADALVRLNKVIGLMR